MTDRNITTDGMTEAQIEAATCPDPHRVVKNRDVDNKDVVNSEELIRGMTEMAERFTARMDAASSQIDELRECLILAVKELDAIPATTPYTKTICARARQALGLQ